MQGMCSISNVLAGLTPKLSRTPDDLPVFLIKKIYHSEVSCQYSTNSALNRAKSPGNGRSQSSHQSIRKVQEAIQPTTVQSH